MRKYFILSFTFKEDKSLTRGLQLNIVSEPRGGGYNVSVLPSWKLSGKEILANKAQGPRAKGFISQYSHSTQFPTG